MMFYKDFTEGLENLKDSINNAYKDEKHIDTDFSKQAIYFKYFFISLYTIWETGNLKAFSKAFEKYRHVLETNKIKFQAFEKASIKREFKPNLEKKLKENPEYDFITVDVKNIFDSDNLKFDKALDFIGMFGCSKNDVKTYLNSPELNDILSKLSASGIEIVKKTASSNKFENIIFYVDYVVRLRNRHAHYYSIMKKKYASFSLETANDFIDFFNLIAVAFDNLLQDYIYNALIKSNDKMAIQVNNLNDLIILNKKNKSCDEISLKIKASIDYRYYEDTTFVLFNEKKEEIIKKVNTFDLKKIEKINDDGSKLEVNKFEKDSTYQVNLRESFEKRAINTKESEAMKLFIIL